MAFQTLDFVSIVAGMLNHAKATNNKITDFQVGSVARTLMEAPAIEIEEFYQQVFLGLREAIPVAIYLSFGFDRLPPSPASGFVRFSRAGDVAIPAAVPAGTRVNVPGSEVIYSTTADAIIPAGQQSTQVLVIADRPGAVGNTGAETITVIATPLAQVGSVRNEAPFVNGVELESDSQRASRFAEFIRAISRGTIPSLHFAANKAVVTDETGRVVEFVTRTGGIEEAGRYRMFIYGSLGTPSTLLLAEAQRIIDGYIDPLTEQAVPGWRPAGVDVPVAPMNVRPVNFGITLQMLPGFTITTETRGSVRNALERVVDAVRSGDVLFVDAVVEAILSVRGVQRVLVDNNENVLCAPNEVLTVGTVTLQEI